MIKKKLLKPISARELYNIFGNLRTDRSPIIFTKDYTKNLKTNLLTPSRTQSYSCCVEYITRWFYNKFPEGFFKQTHIDLEHILYQRKKYTFNELLTSDKPAASIRVSLDQSYNREMLDQYNYGTTTYNNKTSYRDAFFKDSDRNLMISMQMEMLLLNFSFRMLFAEQGIQIDVANRAALAYRANATQKHYVNLDFHIPDELLVQLAEDTDNFVCPCTGKILDAEKFVKYFNQRSSLPLYYKFDASKHKMQYYLRVSRCLVHIRTNDIQIDEGQRDGNLMNNYTVSFDCQVRFPSPKFYAYYSLKERKNTLCVSRLDEKSFGIFVTSLAQIPNKNEKGWDRKLETIYRFDDDEINKPKTIDFSPMIGDLRDAITLTKKMAISPDVFLDMRVYNNFKRVPCEIDWYNCKIKIDDSLKTVTCCIVLYIDGAYYAEILNVLNEYYKNRIQPDDTQIEHKYISKPIQIDSLNRSIDKVKENIQEECS